MHQYNNSMLEWNNGTATYHRQLLAHAGASSFEGTDTPFTLSWQNILGMLLSVLVSMITGPGGQGGANFYIPLFNVLLGFSVAEAAAISSFIVFLGCISSTLHAMAAPHPTNPSKPRIDYITVLVMLPMLLLGVSYGVMANAIMPAWLLNIFLVLLWAWSCSKLFKASKAAYSKERKQLAAAAAAAAGDSTALPAGQHGSSSSRSQAQDIEAAHGTQAASSSDASAHNSSSSSFMCRVRASISSKCTSLKAWSAIQPWIAMAGVAGLFVGFVGLTVVRDVATVACQPSYWAVLGVQSGCLLAGAAVVSLVLLRSNRRANSSSSSSACSSCSNHSADTDCKCNIQVVTDADAADSSSNKATAQAFNLAAPAQAAADSSSSTSWVGRARAALAARAAAKQQATALAFIINEEAIVWTVKKLLVVPPVMLLIGVIASMLGVGGAAFVNPLILGWGLHPQVGAGTSRLVLMLSTGGSALSFLAAGRLNIVYALVYGGINVVFTPLGIHVMDWFVARTGHASYITLLSLIRTVIGVGVQFGLSLVPSLIALHTAPPPMLGFNPQGLCH